jgi:hypothetical protein
MWLLLFLRRKEGGRCKAKGCGTAKWTTSHTVQTKHGSRIEHRDHYRAQYEYTHPVTGQYKCVTFESDDNQPTVGLPLFNPKDAKRWFDDYHQNKPTRKDLDIALDGLGEVAFVIDGLSRSIGCYAFRMARLLLCIIAPVLLVAKLALPWTLEGDQQASWRDPLLFFTDRSSLPHGFIDSPSFDGSYYAAFQTATGLYVAICILALVVVGSAVPTLLGCVATRATKSLRDFKTGNSLGNSFSRTVSYSRA